MQLISAEQQMRRFAAFEVSLVVYRAGVDDAITNASHDSKESENVSTCNTVFGRN